MEQKTVLGRNYNDSKAIAGYGSVLTYRDSASGETKYHLLIPLETVPAPTGSVNTFDFDILTATSSGLIQGRSTLEQKEVDFLYHRDNVRRLKALRGKTLDFMTVTGDGVGQKFTGTMDFRLQDPTSDVLRGTLTITPISETEEELDVRSQLMPTVNFTSAIDDSIVVASGIDGTSITITTDPKIDLSSGSAVSIEEHSNGTTNPFTVTTTYNSTTGANTIKIVQAVNTSGTYYGILLIKASTTGYAEYDMSVLLSYTVA